MPAKLPMIGTEINADLLSIEIQDAKVKITGGYMGQSDSGEVQISELIPFIEKLRTGSGNVPFKTDKGQK